MSVLAHLAGVMGEPGVTKALAYLLNRQAALLHAFLNLLGPAGIQFDPRPRVEFEIGSDDGRPDMRIYDMNGNLRVLVENKFWAGLTGAQPVGYLNMLPEDLSSGLLFIVPRRRVNMIWNALQERCQDVGLDLEHGLLGGDRVTWVVAGVQRAMLITDWENALDVLEGAADGFEVRSDIFQFGRLVEKLDSESFLPLLSDEVTNADIPRRIINYIQLIDDICMQLQNSGMSYLRTQAAFAGPHYGHLQWGNNQDGTNDAYLTLSFHAWRESGGITPLWLSVNQAVHLPGDVDVHQFDNHPGGFHGYNFIPVRLRFGVERERAIENAVEQILRIVQP